MVSDACVPLLLQFTHLTQLSIAKTKLTSEGQAQLIYNLKHLLLLPRGDFLCDALGKNLTQISFNYLLLFQNGLIMKMALK